ncbi:MAG: hypothetical protein KGM99_14165 [Burkholderiales bacterium]|nr:hypothetical protein [Burkholderiales bacterium]
MPLEMMREYEVEYSSAPAPDSGHWVAMLTIYGPSHNPMHRNCVFHKQRVALESVFPTAVQAEEEARNVALRMIERTKRHSS